MTSRTAPTSTDRAATAVCEGRVPTSTVHTLKITLRGMEPEVSRVVEVPSDITLDKLAEALIDAMGWLGGHLHIFTVRRTGTKYWPTRWDDWNDSGHEDETEHRLGDILYRSRMKMNWEYDLGACWHHEIVVVSIAPSSDGVVLPRCVGRTGDCPPDT